MGKRAFTSPKDHVTAPPFFPTISIFGLLATQVFTTTEKETPMPCFTILLATWLVLTGPTTAFADPITEAVFDEEFRTYVIRPCMRVLADKAGVLKFFENKAVTTGTEQWALLDDYFDMQISTLMKQYFGQRKTALFNTIERNPLASDKRGMRSRCNGASS